QHEEASVSHLYRVPASRGNPHQPCRCEQKDVVILGPVHYSAAGKRYRQAAIRGDLRCATAAVRKCDPFAVGREANGAGPFRAGQRECLRLVQATYEQGTWRTTPAPAAASSTQERTAAISGT